ncbi:polysaccharide pyruvyl transferase family protein [Bacteroides sp.]
MKLGILTYHRTLNYGGCLQAMATRVVLEQMGHEVYYVDYWPDYHSYFYEPFSINKLVKTHGVKNKLSLLLNAVKYGKCQEKRRENFDVFLETEIIPFCRPMTESYDAVIYGSDQIWRKQPVLNEYNPIYFADNSIPTKKHIAFSASMGIIPTTDSDKKNLEKMLTTFNSISVREKELQTYCSQITNIDIQLTADPTLLLPEYVWQGILNIGDYQGPQYILVYALHDTFDFHEIAKFAKSRGLIVKIIYGDAKQADSQSVITTAGPVEFLRLIKNAEFVFSSSFHGLAFSLIFKKEFLVSFGSNSGRAKSLLAEVGLSNRFIFPKSKISEKLTLIDYGKVEQKLQGLRQRSINYLNESLK